MAAAQTTTAPHPLDNIDTDFISCIEYRIPQAEKWTDDEMYDFISDLDDIGITTEQEFNDRFYGAMDYSHNIEAEFAEEFIDSVHNINSDAMQAVYHAIDWQRVWDHSLCYDFDYITQGGYGGDIYFFNNH